MKLVYLSNALIPSRQANSIHIMKICSAFSEIGFDVSLVCKQNSENDAFFKNNNVFKFYGTKKKFKLYFSRNSNSLFLLYYFALKSLLICIINRPSIVVSRFLLAGFLSSFFFKTIVELHQLPLKKSRIQKYVLKYLKYAPRFKGLVVITNPLKDLFIEEGFSEDSIYVFPDGADEVENINQDTFKNLDKQKVNIGYAGHLYKGRGVELLFDLAALCPWVFIHIAGGNKEDIEFHQKIINENLITNIKMYGFLEPSAISKFYLKMDILAAPYQRKVHLQSGDITTEKWMSPLKVFEYMASGKPIICSNIEVLKEVLEHERNCLLCDPENIKEWAEAIDLLRNNPEISKSISTEALSDLNNIFSWKKRAKNISDIIF